MPDLVVVLDSAGRIMLFNHSCEELTGYHRDEVIGRDLMDLLVPQAWLIRVRERFSESLQSDAIQPAKYPWRTMSGDDRWIMASRQLEPVRMATLRWRCWSSALATSNGWLDLSGSVHR